MTAPKKRSKKQREKPPAPKDLRVVWKFDDGDLALPITDVEAQLQAQYHGMARSDDPYLRAEGKRLIAEAAEQALAKRLANARAAESSRLPRPGRKKPIRERILEMMRSRKAAEIEFKVLMEAWEREAFGGLRLTAIDAGSVYEVDDENADLRPARYKWKYLQKLYSGS